MSQVLGKGRTGIPQCKTHLTTQRKRGEGARGVGQVLGEDVAPGVKKGGFLRMVRWDVKCLCYGWAIPPFLEVDASKLEAGDSLNLSHLDLPEGVGIAEKVHRC